MTFALPWPTAADRRRWIEMAGFAGACLFAFGAWAGIALANVGTTLMLLALLGDGRRVWGVLRRSVWPWLLLASLATLAISTWQAWPEVSAALHREDAGKLARLWAFLLVAWWLGGDVRRIWWLLALALAGFTWGRFASPDLRAVATLPPGERLGFGLPILAFGQYAAMALLGLGLAAPRLWRLRGGALRIMMVALWCAAVLLLVQGLLIAQARAIWLLLALLLPLLLWLGLRGSGRAALSRRELAVIVVLLLVGAGFLARHFDAIAFRFAAETASFQALLDGRIADVDYGSVGMRVHAWLYGTDLLAARPWFGWGPGAVRHLLETAPDAGIRTLADFHDLYLELPIRIGLLGSLPFAIGTVVVFAALQQARRERRLPRDLYLILLAALLLHFAASVTNMRTLNFDWRFYWMLFAGAATTFALQPRAPSTST